VKVLTGQYETKEDAAQKIRESITAFYKEKYPEAWAKERPAIEKATLAVIGIYQMNFFPRMKVAWKEYPNNIGHLIFPGCFRCHNGSHESSGGRTISNDCAQCHTIISQGAPGAVETQVEGLAFKHPDPATGEMWKDMKCYECHTGDVE
jgi:cytochrome c2